MSLNKIIYKKPFKIIVSFLIIWIILFQFIFSGNNILPRPIILLESFNDIISDYQLIPNLLYSIGAITFGIIASIFSVYFLRYYLLTQNLFSDLLQAISKPGSFVPIFIFSIFLIFWLPQSIYIEYLFLAFISLGYISLQLIDINKTLSNAYFNSAKSLGISKKKIATEIKFKQIIPSMEKTILVLNINIWGILLVYEFIQNTNGLGSVLHNSLILKDIYSIFFTSLIICIFIIIIQHIIQIVFNRFVHWE